MLFNSLPFLLFFPIVTLLYFIIPHKVRWVWLLAASYFFYACWNPRYLLLMFTSTLITWLSGILIHKSGTLADEKKAKRLKITWVALSFALNLSILFFFKYFDFALGSLNQLLLPTGFQLVHPAFDLLLPVGISFYTFQALSYTMDIYRGDIACIYNLGKYALFVSFFPQLVAGPIERSTHLLPQFEEVHRFEWTRVRDGLWLMLWGYFQKVVIADRVVAIVDTVYNNYGDYGGAELAVATGLFAVQIYCDFCGYSNIAVGAAQVMGFDLTANFKQPYFATSIQDFWRRWHITLSTWFRDYLYIPLGGNRKGKLRWAFNLMVTFLVSGLWHGARWSFVVWGGLHGLYQILGRVLAPAKNKLYDALKINRQPASFRLGQVLVTFALVTFAWVFFRAPGLSAARDILVILFTRFDPWVLFDGTLYTLGLDVHEFFVMLAALGVLLAGDLLQRRVRVRSLLARQNMAFRWAFSIAAIMVLLVFGVYGYSYQARNFIYFQF